MESFVTQELNVDFCVVGGGMAGVCAAVAAARHGAKTVLIQDRPMLGGNASSEIRMWICGAHGPNIKETGLLEEVQLENMRYNPSLQYNVWDYVLINFVQREPNITLLLNTTCNDVRMMPEDASRIKSVIAWQLSTQKQYIVNAKSFADCSGDSVLRKCGAEYRMGREGRAEFNESHAPEVPDNKTMGNSILLQTKRVNHHKPFEPLPWAEQFQMKGFRHGLSPNDNFWWMEVGGEQDTIKDAEEIRDKLLKIAYGVWALAKNHEKTFRDYDLEWVGVLPGKRENVRYVGDHILTQNDVEKQGKFDDIVAYGGWSMDDHNPAAFYSEGAPTIFHPAPSPYGIPFRCLYSKNISNLYFAGRNISCTHMAMSSTRVMATCAMEGQAIGTAAAIGAASKLDPRGVYEQKMEELQQTLMDDDSYLPWHKRAIPAVSRNAKLVTESGADAEVLRNGCDRVIGEEQNCYVCEFGQFIEYHFDKPTVVNEARFVFDSDLSREHSKRMRCTYSPDDADAEIPETLIKEYSVQILTVKGAKNWEELVYEEDNCKRLVKLPINRKISAIRFIPEASWGAENARIFSFDVR